MIVKKPCRCYLKNNILKTYIMLISIAYKCKSPNVDSVKNYIYF